jgi:hypothetical protein
MVSGWIISGPRGGDRRYLKLRCFSGSAHDLGVESRLNLLKGIFIFSAWKVAREGTTGRKKQRRLARRKSNYGVRYDRLKLKGKLSI